MVEKSKLDEDKEGKAVDPSHYRGTVHRGSMVSKDSLIALQPFADAVMLVVKDNTPTSSEFIHMKIEISAEPTSTKLMVEHAEYDESNTYVLERFNTTAGNPVKKILLKLNLSDHRILKDGGEVKEFQRSFRHSDTERLSRSDEVLKLKNFKKDATLKLSKSTNQEWYEHVGPEVTRSQDDKVTRWRNKIMLG
ncbi:hypothetical protein Tco_1042556 [Tanacetum coccineum]|uniref:Uncharacterized protein n=1 Tax=Tanacetum coccineum TaxID=301880 RepID=A0ABQ5GJR3_9ASTR